MEQPVDRVARRFLRFGLLRGGFFGTDTVTDLALNVVAPSTAGIYCLQFDLLHTGITWFSWTGASLSATTVTVP